MKKSVVSILILGVLIFIYFIGNIVFLSIENDRKKYQISNINNFYKIDTKIQQNDKPSIFIAFGIDCDHCQYEAKSINERQKDLENTNIVLFTSANDSLTNVFSHTYGLDTIKNVQVISDKNDEMRQLFDVKTIPSIFIYNKDGQLVKQYKGETKIDAILKAIAP